MTEESGYLRVVLLSDGEIGAARTTGRCRPNRLEKSRRIPTFASKTKASRLPLAE